MLGGYRDRLAVELAQNAADAAARAGVPGRLRLTLHPANGGAPAVLVASNTGAPLDATGVESLSTLRASAKREAGAAAGAVGRFGVGFAAVLSVSDEPALVGRTGGVRWSLAEARTLAQEVAAHSPGLGGELRRREGHVPLLRLPLPAEGTAPDGYDTAVVLPLRDGAAQDLAERLLDGIDAALLLTLPGLAEVVVETPEGVRELRRRQDGPYVLIEDSERGATRWRVATDGGSLDPALLADRPVEERLRPSWSVTWAVPVDSEGAPARPGTAPVVHAPTPTDEPLGLPGLLIASFPLEPTRRHVHPGPLTDFLVERVAEVYAALLADWQPVSVATLDLVPGPLGKGGLDGELRRRVLALLPRVRFLPSAGAPGEGSGPSPRPRRRAHGTPARTRCAMSCGPWRPRWSRVPGPRRSRCWPSCSPACCRPASNGARSCGRWAWPGCRSGRWSTAWRASSGPPTGGGGCTTRWPAPTRTGSADCPCRSRARPARAPAGPPAPRAPPSGRARCCCRCPAAAPRTARTPPGTVRSPGSG
ncbi:sacsin N-terminal ATP-binding-like domain-containing protein [Streptomyces sirii]|uniref:sacsin N-terminal ATP-binding-like domain-containing protein n=1 Tax=Streptomyces sirii TaxID=3127701 RepID=UPI003D36A1CE